MYDGTMITVYVVLTFIALLCWLFAAFLSYHIDKNKENTRRFILMSLTAPIWPILVALGVAVGLYKTFQFAFSKEQT